MKITGIVLLCCAILVSGQAPNPDHPDTTTIAAETTTVSPPETTTKKVPTTTVPTKTSTSTSTTTSTTTEKPAPPPAPPVPPTPTPIPEYPHNVGKWSVEDSKKSSCIALKAAMQIVVKNQNKTHVLNIPPFATSGGSCAPPEEITLTWNSTVLTDDQKDFMKNELVLQFVQNKSKSNLQAGADSGITVGKYGVQNLTATIYLDVNGTNNDSANPLVVSLTNIDVFQTPLNHSYSCLAEEEVKSENDTFILKIREVQMEAYRSEGPGHREFSSSVQCPADDATDVVPIAVGAALAGLVVIVLIAYLIGRRRSRARGYHSV